MNTRKLEVWILVADLAWIGVAFLGADLLRFGLTWDPDERVSIHALLPFVIAACFIWIALSALGALMVNLTGSVLRVQAAAPPRWLVSVNMLADRPRTGYEQGIVVLLCAAWRTRSAAEGSLSRPGIQARC